MAMSPARQSARDLVVSAFPIETAIDPRLLRNETSAQHGERHESAAIGRLFAGKAWPDVVLDTLRHRLGGFHQGAFHFLSPKAQAYYAPSLMLIALDHGADADLFLDDAVDIFSPDFSSDPAAFIARFEGYTAQQKSAVAAFLEVIANEDFGGTRDSRPAATLRSHWAS